MTDDTGRPRDRLNDSKGIAIPTKTKRPAPPATHASTVACGGVCGYLIGLAVPLFPHLDLPLVFLVSLATIAALMGLKQPKPFRSLAVVPVIGFVAARLLSSMMGPHLDRNLHSLAPFLPALLLFYVLAEWVETKQQIAAVYVSLTVVGLVLATTLLVVARFSNTTDADAWALAVPSPILVVKNDITIVAVLAPVALALASFRPRRPIQLMVLGFFASLITAIYVVQSRTALVTTVAAITCFTAFARRKVAWLLVAVVVFAVVLDALAGFGFLHKAMQDWQGSGRLALWTAALAMFRDAPLLGQGTNSYVVHYRTYLDALQLPTWIHVDWRDTPWAHNLYLELLAEQGLLGLVSFSAVGAVGLFMVNRINRSRHTDARCLGAGAGAALVAFLIAACFELSFIRAWVTIILFTLLGLLTAITHCAERAEAC